MSEKELCLKTLKGWEEHGESWDKYCKPGELVDEDVYWHFLNVLPPRSMGAGYLQVGGAYDYSLNPKTGKYASTYMTFVKVDNGILRELLYRRNKRNWCSDSKSSFVGR